MSTFLRTTYLTVVGVFVLFSAIGNADLPPLQESLINPQSSTTPAPTKPREEPPVSLPPLGPRKLLPLMSKPFGMPGVVGYQNNQWQGTDYLGFLSPDISINVEVVAGANTPHITDTAPLETIVSQAFAKGSLIPRAEVKEGPPLPFLHLLLFVYPCTPGRYVIFGAARLFEQVQVIRPNFTPAGYWQAITWENQDVVLAEGGQIDAQLKAIVEKLATAFVQRYRAYNLIQGATPPNVEIPAYPQAK